MFSSFSSRPVSSSGIDSTATISGIFSIKRRSIPIFIVIVELGHDPHAPCNFTRTTFPSISCNATLPPSDIRYGRISSKTLSTFSSVKGTSKIDSGVATAFTTVHHIPEIKSCTESNHTLSNKIYAKTDIKSEKSCNLTVPKRDNWDYTYVPQAIQTKKRETNHDIKLELSSLESKIEKSF